MAKDGKANHPGIVAEFRKRASSVDQERARVIWTSKAYDDAPAAPAAIDEELAEPAGLSGPTMEIVTGVGRTGKPSARAARYESNRI